MEQQELCILLGLNRANQATRRQARELASVEQIVERLGQSLKPVEARLVTASLAWQQAENQGIIGYFDPLYPSLLKTLAEPPWLLYYQGRTELLATESVALVGSRKASHSGLHTANWLAQDFAHAGLVVVSGLAMGIDAEAHQAAVEFGRTIAVLGTGIDQVYPRRNRQLHRLIAHQGLLISELPPTVGVKMDHFPRRNRIISGLSKGTVVVEATQRSGSISTALAAINQGRHVGAVPGSIFASESAGCHWLLRQGAELVTAPSDIWHWFSSIDTSKVVKAPKQPYVDESLANDKLFANVGFEVTSVDNIIQRSGLSAAEVTEQLLLLELKGAVVAVPGGYIKVGRR